LQKVDEKNMTVIERRSVSSRAELFSAIGSLRELFDDGQVDRGRKPIHWPRLASCLQTCLRVEDMQSRVIIALIWPYQPKAVSPG
jgi:hypothetical protein